MVVAVEHGLEYISEQLRGKGYTIVSYPEYGGVVDAFIYKEEMYHNTGQYAESEESLENYTFSSPRGILIVNANNKSLQQIEEILQKRIYSPLF